MSVEILRAHVRAVRQSHEAIANATSLLLTYERQDNAGYAELHRALRGLGEALRGATEAQRELARIVGIDPDSLTSPNLDDIVAPLFEGDTAHD